MNLTTTNDPQAFVAGASPDGIGRILQDSMRHVRRWQRWLGVRNSYPRKVALLKKSSDIDSRRMAEYIACSAPLHLTDGWNYVSRAFEAALRGDHGAAYHLAYYAELRAAMSFLASEGIGIFNRMHIALDGSLQATAFGGATHHAAWQTLEAWASQREKAPRILDSVEVDSRSLSHWLFQAGVSDVKQSILAKELLLSWSIDLKVVGRDQDRRNEVTYRPTRITAPSLPPVDEPNDLMVALLETWEWLEPVGWGPGAQIDLMLLYQALDYLAQKRALPQPSIQDAIDALSDGMSPTTVSSLKECRDSLPWLFDQARIEGAPGGVVLPVLARALLMLRVASATTASLLASAGVVRADVEFWWSSFGRDFGLWQQEDDIEMFADLMADVLDAKDLIASENASASGSVTVVEIARIANRHLALTQFARASLWLMGLEQSV